jgi:O-acetyl-ADP-ribose deacetylase (regulator of RNase III)
MLPTASQNYVVDIRVGDPDLVRLSQGDITQHPADAIVNAANSSLMGGGGVDGAIHRAGGTTILEECMRIRSERGPLPTGQAVATTAGRLSAKYVIHTVGPIWRGGDEGEPELLASCYRESMRVAHELKLQSIAFPAISAGVYGYPLEEAARIALTTVTRELPTSPTLALAEFVLFSRSALDIFARVAHEIAPEKINIAIYG